MSRRQNCQTIAWFQDLNKRGLIELDPPYQRRSVWTQKYKDDFIDTILLDYPAPTIFLYEEIDSSGSVKYNVVDGKQRLTTIFEFVSNSFPISDASEMHSLRGMYFEQIPDKTKFWRYNFSVEYLASSEENIINNIFDRINRNVAKLSPQELRHAKFGGLFITAAEDLTEWMFATLPSRFPQIAEKSRNQMKDVELVTQLLLLIEEGPKGYSQDELDIAHGKRDEIWEAKGSSEAAFRDTIMTIRELTIEPSIVNSRFKNQADFYSLFGAIFQLKKDNHLPPLESMKTKLSDFMTRLDSDERDTDPNLKQYYDAARTATNITGSRDTRVRVIKSVLQKK